MTWQHLATHAATHTRWSVHACSYSPCTWRRRTQQPPPLPPSPLQVSPRMKANSTTKVWTTLIPPLTPSGRTATVRATPHPPTPSLPPLTTPVHELSMQLAPCCVMPPDGDYTICNCGDNITPPRSPLAPSRSPTPRARATSNIGDAGCTAAQWYSGDFAVARPKPKFNVRWPSP